MTAQKTARCPNFADLSETEALQALAAYPLAASGVARLDSGLTSLQLLDIGYFARELARPGYEAMQNLKQQLQQGGWPGERAAAVTGAEAAGSEAVAEIIDGTIRRIDLNYHSRHADPADEVGEAVSRERVSQIMQDLGLESGAYPESLLEAVSANLHGKSPSRLVSARFYFFPVDLDRDGETEYLLLEQGIYYTWIPGRDPTDAEEPVPGADEDGNFYNYILFYRDDEETNFGWSTRTRYRSDTDQPTINMLLRGDFRVVPPTPPRWGQIQVGGENINFN